MLVNTKEFSREAQFFNKYGRYDCGTKGSIQYRQFWEREKIRCRYGYKVGDLWITGYHYYYLNYCRIEIVEKATGDSKNKSASRRWDFPQFWDVDYVFFMSCHIARWGVGILDPLNKGDYERGFKEYKKLPINLGLVETRSNLSGGKHLLWLKPRGVGASYKAAAMFSRNFHLIPKMKNFMFADDKEYLIKDGLFSKFVDYKSFLDTKTEFAVRCDNKSSITDMHYIGSFQNDDGKTQGTLSQGIGVSFKNEPEKARGKRGILALWEEFGKFPNADIAWNIARNSFEEAGLTYGIMIGFGTGGSEGNDFYSMETMSQSPEAYNLLEFNNVWDTGMEGTSFGMFTPAYYNIQFKDEHGNSLTAEAKKEYEEQRKQALKSPDPSLIERRKAESPFTPQEAMLNTVSNLFMVEGMGDWINRVTADSNIHSLGVPKELYRGEDGSIQAKLNEEHRPIMKYPHTKKDDVFGSVVEWTTPYKDKNGKVPDNLYIIGHDPFAEDDVEDVTSLGSAYVYMNPSNYGGGDMGDRIVASWNGRPTTTDEYNRILFMLAERWNAKIGFENDRGDVLGYAKRYKLEHWLADEFDLAWDDKITTKKKSSYKYGMRMGSGSTNVRLLTGNRYIADWLVTPRGMNEQGKFSYNYNYILDVGLLTELKMYNGKRNADRISALRILMYHAKELAYSGIDMKKKTSRKINSSKSRFFREN
jgi:hypothetical protein